MTRQQPATADLAKQVHEVWESTFSGVPRTKTGKAFVLLAKSQSLHLGHLPESLDRIVARIEAEAAAPQPAEAVALLLREALERCEFALTLVLSATIDDRTWLDEAMAAAKQARAALREQPR